MSLPQTLLHILVCPQTKQPLQYDPLANELISVAAKVAYPVRDGLPILLTSEARTLSDGELKEALIKCEKR